MEHVPLEANKTSEQYLNDLRTKPEHKNEYGMTIKAELIYAILKLQRDNVAIDDPYADRNGKQGKGKLCFCIGSYYKDPGSSLVPYFCWSRSPDRRQASLNGSGPGGRSPYCGARSLGGNMLA